MKGEISPKSVVAGQMTTLQQVRHPNILATQIRPDGWGGEKKRIQGWVNWEGEWPWELREEVSKVKTHFSKNQLFIEKNLHQHFSMSNIPTVINKIILGFTWSHIVF